MVGNVQQIRKNKNANKICTCIIVINSYLLVRIFKCLIKKFWNVLKKVLLVFF